jgi:hypothetical protein
MPGARLRGCSCLPRPLKRPPAFRRLSSAAVHPAAPARKQEPQQNTAEAHDDSAKGPVEHRSAKKASYENNGPTTSEAALLASTSTISPPGPLLGLTGSSLAKQDRTFRAWLLKAKQALAQQEQSSRLLASRPADAKSAGPPGGQPSPGILRPLLSDAELQQLEAQLAAATSVARPGRGGPPRRPFKPLQLAWTALLSRAANS